MNRKRGCKEINNKENDNKFTKKSKINNEQHQNKVITKKGVMKMTLKERIKKGPTKLLSVAKRIAAKRWAIKTNQLNNNENQIKKRKRNEIEETTKGC